MEVKQGDIRKKLRSNVTAKVWKKIIKMLTC